MKPVLITPSLFVGNEFYVFRPIGNDAYREIKFNIVNSKIVENPNNKLHSIEKHYIKSNIISWND